MHILLNPNFAFIFFYAGLMLIVAELLHPGLSLPGLGGLIFLGLALASFGMLPVQLVGIVLLVCSIGFFFLELKHPHMGIASIAGIASVILGGLFLFDRSTGRQVSGFVIAAVAIVAGCFFTFTVKATLKARHLPAAQGYERMVGLEGYAATDLSPAGVVQIAAETWSAEAAKNVEKGKRIKVTAINGLQLKVVEIEQ